MMFELLKKKTRKSYVIRAIVSAVVMFAVLALTHFAIFDVISGPVKLDIEKDPDTYKGKYVTIAAEAVLVDYAGHNAAASSRDDGSDKSAGGYSYIAFQSVDDPENNTSIWYFYSIYMDKEEQDKMHKMIDATWAYLEDETKTVEPPDTLTVTGTWTPMESEVEQYYLETLAEMGVEETEFDRFYFYNLDTAKIGGMSAMAFWVLMVVAVLLLLYTVYNVFRIFSKQDAWAIHDNSQENTTTSVTDMDSTIQAQEPTETENTVSLDPEKAKNQNE